MTVETDKQKQKRPAVLWERGGEIPPRDPISRHAGTAQWEKEATR